jgi:nitroreductase
MEKDVTESLMDLMGRRRTVRQFLDRPVPPEMLREILEAGRLAPSGANAQPWLFVVVEDAAVRRELRALCEEGDKVWHANAPAWVKEFLLAQEIMPVKPFLTDAPHLIAVFGDNRKPYWRDGVWISAAYMLLEMERLGLSTVTYTPGRTDFLNRLLGVEKHFVPVVLFPVGYAAESPDPAKRRRKPLAELVKVVGKNVLGET